MIQYSVSTNGCLFQSMLLLINPTRLLLMIAAAGKNVRNFNIFAALLHSILHFSSGLLSVKFQTEFLPWISFQSSFLLPLCFQIWTISRYKTGLLLSSACSIHIAFLKHLSFLSCLFTPTAFLSFPSPLTLHAVLGSPCSPHTSFNETGYYLWLTSLIFSNWNR